MRKSTRFVGLILCVLMLMHVVPAIAFAENDEVDFETLGDITEPSVIEEERLSAENESALDEIVGVLTTDSEIQTIIDVIPEEIVTDETCGSEVNSYSVSVTGIYHQTEARSMLSSINDFRTGDDAWAWNSNDTEKIYYEGLSELSYNYSLEKDAMQRAAEIAVYFSHTRPNGGSCYSVRGDSYTWVGENIGAGSSYTSAGSAFTAWKEDNESYSGQGHRRNMLDRNINCVGIACFQVNLDYYYNTDMYFWVQEFGRTGSSTTAVDANDTVAVVDVYLNSELIDSVELKASQENYRIRVQESAALPAVQAIVNMSGTEWKYPPKVSPKVVDYSVSNDVIAEINDDNTVIGIKKGNTAVICEALGSSLSIPLQVRGADEMLYPESEHNYADNANDTKTYTYPGALYLIATFSEDSTTETNKDFIYLYDGEDHLIKTVSGNFNGESITIPGDTMKVVLVSDSEYNFYGYSFDTIEAVMPTLGDVNADETVNELDLKIMRRALADDDFVTLNTYGADVNKDNIIDLRDLLLLKRQLVC